MAKENRGLFRGSGHPLKPYYQDEFTTLYLGDCREVLPEIPLADLVIMDPPYGMEFRSNYRTVKYDAIRGDDALPLDLILMAIAHATRAAYVFCRWDNLISMPKPKSVIAWVKNNWSMGDLKHEHGRQWEACCFYPRAAHEFIERIPDVIHADRTGNELHPAQKPVPLMARIIAANVGELVLDPFAGSGTTLWAAKALRRRSVGVEIEEKWAEVAARRLALPVQDTLFL